MNTLAAFLFARLSQFELPLAAWDLDSFFTNSKEYLTKIGGGLISFLGLCIIIWAAVLITKKFFGSAQGGGGDSWFKIVAMLLVGGALLSGGILLIMDISSGGQKTLEDLGNGGFIVLQSILPGRP